MGTLACSFLALPAALAQTQQYIYDEAGNVVEIRRLAAGELAILQFAPLRGPIGSTVTIHGQGFHATLGSNTLRFNGVVASLVSGSTTQLVATVPAGATTGPISVSNGSATVGSARPFTVTAGPTITSFTPIVGTASASVTIIGTNYDPLPINNHVSFVGTPAATTASTTTSIGTTVPTTATSGRISVSTSTGTATSAADFFVPPTGIAPASVAFTGRAAIDDAPTAISIPVGKVALFLVDANAGDTLTVYLDTLSGGNVPVSIYGPGGTLLGAEAATAVQPWARMPTLTSTGTFTLLLSGTSAAFSASVRVARAPRMTLDGTFVASTITVANQPKRVAVSGIAGQSIGVGFTSPALTPSSGYFTIEVLRPDVAAMQTEYCYVNGDYCSANLTIPTTGEYSLWIKTPSATTGSIQSGASSDVTATLTAGTPYTLTTTRAGQNGRLTFAGTAGTVPTLKFAAHTANPAGQSLTVNIYKPDGALLTSSLVSPAGITWPLPMLPATGNYVVFVEPRATSKGAATITSARITLDSGVALALDGASATAPFAAAGEGAVFSFAGVSGQTLGLGVTGVTFSPTSVTYATVTVVRPDGSTLLTDYCYSNGDYCAANLTVPSTGSYRVLVQPSGSATGSATAWLTSDLTATLTPGTAYTLATTRAGQNARLAFAGTAGPAPAIEFAATTTNPTGQSLNAVLLKPDGSTLGSTVVPSAGVTWTLPSLPTAGTYTVFVDPRVKSAATIGSARITVEPGVVVTIDGASASASFATPGESARFVFTTTTGQHLGLGFTSLTLAPPASTYASFTIYKPDGSYLANSYCYPNDDYCAVNLTNTAAGQHSVVIQPISGGTGSIQAWLSTDTTGTLTFGTPLTIATTRAGQNARRTFSGTSGQLLRLSVSALSTTPTSQSVSFAVLKPDGSVLTSTTTYYVPYNLDLPALPSTGTYTLLVDPATSAKGHTTLSATVQIAVR